MNIHQYEREQFLADLRQKTHFAARDGGQRSYLKNPDCDWDTTGRYISIRQENESCRHFQTVRCLDDTEQRITLPRTLGEQGAVTRADCHSPGR